MANEDQVELEAAKSPPTKQLSEIEDSDGDDDDVSSDGEDFAPVDHQKQHPGNNATAASAGHPGALPGGYPVGGHGTAAAGSYQSGDGYGPGGPWGSMMSTGGGSWYFQPMQGQSLNSAYGSDFYSQYTQGGNTPIPPHLAYWMHQPVSGGLSEMSYGSYGQGQMGQMTAEAMTTINEGGSAGGGAGNPSQQQDLSHLLPPEDEYKVYSSRWIMLMYMSFLNLLSDWTCYSVAPIALLTVKAFGDVDPESLVTIFLGANALASAMEPAILGRLGLRRTVLFGGFLLMMGSIIKSGGLKSIVMSTNKSMTSEEILEEEEEDITWRLYLGFFLVGLSQPLYQCTPALLSASWFPENERTMATGVALNSNQLGIGCAFVFGTMLVATEDDIIPYFGLLSVISTITFIGTALQFDDAPPTPPSDTARVMKGDLEFKIPKIPFFGFGGRKSSVSNLKDAVDAAPAPASTEESTQAMKAGIHDVEKEMLNDALVAAPSPAPTNDPVDPETPGNNREEEDPRVLTPTISPGAENIRAQPNHPLAGGAGPPLPMPPPGAYPYMMPPPPTGYYPSYPPVSPGMGYSTTAPQFYHGYDQQGHYHNALLETNGQYDEYAQFAEDEGVEPIMTQLDNQLDIDIRDDQLVQQFKACFRRKGFAHCVVAFTTSGIIINTLSTFMDYLVTLNGAGREYVGIVGGTFQVLIMCSSLVFGGWTDHSRKYYFVILAMLIFGAFALAVCNVNLDMDAGGDLRLTLLVVAVLAGPLQPISTELGVEVVYPLSENTVLVVQQLFSNLLSAAFIPVFKALRDVGTATGESEIKGMYEVPQYTFSFYMLIIIHAVSTCYFATFNGTYLRYEAEEAKKAKKVSEREKLLKDLQEKHASGSGLNAGYGSVEPN